MKKINNYEIIIRGLQDREFEQKIECKPNYETELISAFAQAFIEYSMVLGIDKKTFFKNFKDHYKIIQKKFKELEKEEGEN